MTTKKLGRQTVALAHPPSVAGHANVVGKKEGEGPLADSFDQINQDDSFGEKTWEKAETAMQKLALSSALDKAGLSASALDYILAGDLLNQCIGSGFAVRGQDVPFFRAVRRLFHYGGEPVSGRPAAGRRFRHPRRRHNLLPLLLR